MLVVAVTGPVGSEKTSIVHEFARAIQEVGHQVDGFVSLAGKRLESHKGAETYTWRWIETGEAQLFARRMEETGFEIQPEAMVQLEGWANNLPKKADLIVLDEFGKWEAEGKGIMPFWSKIVESRPRMVVVTLRQGTREAIEKQMGRKFHRVLDAEAADTPYQLQAMYHELRDWEIVGTYGGCSGGLECSLGSWLHAGRFPFTGTVMGSFQAAVLALASQNMGRKELIVWVSTISAGLKALSPAGSRVGPMIAISAQGFLFTLGATVGRWTKVGFALGAFLVGLWAALQGFFIQYLLLGRPLERAWGIGAGYLRQKIGLTLPNMWVAVALLCLLNGVIAVLLTLGILVRYPSIDTIERRMEITRSSSKKMLFWLPFVLVTATLLLAGEQPSNILWMLLRVAAIGLTVYGVSKLIARLDLPGFLMRRGRWGPAIAVAAATESRKEGG